jgi:hypothetical protein
MSSCEREILRIYFVRQNADKSFTGLNNEDTNIFWDGELTKQSTNFNLTQPTYFHINRYIYNSDLPALYFVYFYKTYFSNVLYNLHFIRLIRRLHVNGES